MKRYLSALDIGSNSFHLIIAEISENGNIAIVQREREVLRIGTTKNTITGKTLITPDEMVSAAGLISSYNQISKSYNAPIKAIATSAIREAANSAEFANYIFEKTGIEIEIIDGLREAQLIYKGIDSSLKLKDKKLLCVDIGGGSAEIIIGLNGNVLFADSFNAGAVRLTKVFFPNAELNDNAINKCREYINNLFTPLKDKITNIGFDSVVGSSGTAQTAYTLISASKGGTIERINNNVVFTIEDLLSIKELVFSHPATTGRKTIKGMDEKRADIIPAGILVLEAIFEIFHIKEMLVSSAALKEGVIAEMIEK